MAEEGGEGNEDLYGVLGLKKDCSESELRHAYKKLALKWHPDRCSALGNSERVVEEAKNKFQAIQRAYSVLSDANRRFLYDIGAYESDEDDDYNVGMSDFLNEMVSMMSQTKPNGNGGEESMEELQKLLEQMFEADHINSSSSSSSSYVSFKATRNSFYDFDINNIVGSSKESFHFDHHASNNFCFQTNGAASRYEEGKRRKRGGGSSCRSQGHKKQKD